MSLGTRGFRLAEAMAHALDSRFLQALRDTPSVTIAELRRILRDYLQELLDEDMQRRATTPGNVPLYGAWFPGHPTLEIPAHADLEAMQDELDGARDSLQHRDLDAVSDQAAILAERFQVPPSLLPLLSHGLLEVFARYAETRKARTLGDASTVLDISGEAPTPPAPPVPSMQGPRLVAQAEREMISKRTKAALEAAKARGVRLGNPQGFQGRVYRAAGKAAQERATDYAGTLAPTLQGLLAQGLSLHAMARELGSMGIQTARGGSWTATGVRNVLVRLGLHGQAGMPPQGG